MTKARKIEPGEYSRKIVLHLHPEGNHKKHYIVQTVDLHLELVIHNKSKKLKGDINARRKKQTRKNL